jgi:type I restriction enzyme M protein
MNIDIVGKLWGFCNKLRHDGVDSSDYIEQLTYLLFLKMADEKDMPVPEGYDWESLLIQENSNLISHLEALMLRMKNEKGILGEIFAEPVSRVKNGDILSALIKEINSIAWTKIDADVVGLAFEELIGRVANEGKKGAGQYFTPRPLIKTMINVMKPNPIIEEDFRLADVACGTAGFLTLACEWFFENHKKKLTKEQKLKIETDTYFGQELVQRPRRLALMNMFLHGIDSSETIKLGDSIDGIQDDVKFSVVLSNPPFGSKGSAPTNRKFPIKTSDKQLNFIQHIIEKLKDGGRAAIVLPDSCLSSDAAKRVWGHYLDIEKSGNEVCNVHTVLKLPEGIFAAYANGVRACVVFLEKGKPTKTLWMYDGRKDVQKVTTRSNILSEEHFEDFEKCYFKRLGTDRFKPHRYEEIVEKEFELSFVEAVKPESIRHPIIIIDELIFYYEEKIASLKELRTKLPLPDNYKTNQHLNDNDSIKSISRKPKREKTVTSFNVIHT